MTNLLITGSLAYDRIAVFKDKFANHIMPDKIHQLNVAFTVQDMKVEHGGTATGIAYNLSLLGESGVVFGAVGYDGDPILASLQTMGVDTRFVKKIDELITANCTIMTDLSDNQIIAFCDGALSRAHESTFDMFEEDVFMAIISPNELLTMQKCAEWCRQNKVPFIADPGQRIPIFSKEQMQEFVQGAHVLVVNDYEWGLIQEKTGWHEKVILDHVEHLIVTLGERGSQIHTREEIIKIPAYPPQQVADPTGCGDAYRAGLLYGLKNGFSMEKAAHIGAWLAAKCVAEKGTQNHGVEEKEWQEFYQSL